MKGSTINILKARAHFFILANMRRLSQKGNGGSKGVVKLGGDWLLGRTERYMWVQGMGKFMGFMINPGVRNLMLSGLGGESDLQKALSVLGFCGVYSQI